MDGQCRFGVILRPVRASDSYAHNYADEKQRENDAVDLPVLRIVTRRWGGTGGVLVGERCGIGGRSTDFVGLNRIFVRGEQVHEGTVENFVWRVVVVPDRFPRLSQLLLRKLLFQSLDMLTTDGMSLSRADRGDVEQGLQNLLCRDVGFANGRLDRFCGRPDFRGVAFDLR